MFAGQGNRDLLDQDDVSLDAIQITRPSTTISELARSNPFCAGSIAAHLGPYTEVRHSRKLSTMRQLFLYHNVIAVCVSKDSVFCKMEYHSVSYL